MNKPLHNPTGARRYLIKGVPRFDARGLRRCIVPGTGAGIHGQGASAANFWRHPDGTIKLRISYMGYEWSFEVRLSSGDPVPDSRASMDDFTWVVMEELHRWMTEDAADLPPFDDE